MDRILIILKKKNALRASSAPLLGAIFHNIQTCLLVHVYTTDLSAYRTIGPLVRYL